MAVRTALLTSRNINLDTDFSKYIESVSTAGVITGFQVTASSVATGQARVPCIRTNLETIYAFVQNYNSISISGDGYVIISIPQEIVDNWGGNEDGTGIATVEVVDTLPTKNYLLLATITGGVVEDNRYMIPKVDELKTDIDTINEQITDLDVRVDALEQAGAIDHLEERALVWEKYALTDTLFKQLTPALDDCTVEANVWYDAATTEIHIQRQGSGTASNTLKLKLKKAGSPANLVVEVRKWVQVDVSTSEAYWYWDSEQVLATGSIDASDVTTSWQELEVELDAAVWGTEGELLDIVLYQTASAVSSTNYYVMACDSTQWSEGFSYVKVNGTTRTREKLMPYCVSGWFAQALLSKVSSAGVTASNLILYNDNWQYTTKPNTTWYSPISTYKIKDGTTNINCKFYGKVGGASWYAYRDIYYKIGSWSLTAVTDSSGGVYENTVTVNSNVSSGDDIIIEIRYKSSVNRSDTQYWGMEITGNWYIYKTSNINWKPIELKTLWKKTSITILWVTVDNNWYDTNEETDESKYLSNTETWQVNFCKSKGSYHSSQKEQSYTMVWYGYLIYNVVWVCYISINGENYRRINTNYYWDGIIFLKPWDIIESSKSFGNSDIWLVYDYY